MSSDLLTQVHTKNDKKDWETPMAGAALYYRARAQLCLELASLLSDAAAAAGLRAEAAEHEAHAVKLETCPASRRRNLDPSDTTMEDP